MQNPLPAMQSFIFGAGTDSPTYETLQRRRKIADLLQQQATDNTPTNGWEGANAVAQALASKFIDRKIAPQEDAERKRISDLLMGGGMGAPMVGSRDMPAPAPDMPATMPGAGPQSFPGGDIQAMAMDAAKRHGLPPDLFLGLVKQESGFKPDAVSSAGAIGLTQLMPGTAADLGVDPRDPAQNLEGGARYLRQQLDKFGDPALALAAYNAGPGAVQKYGGIPPYDETQAYVQAILGRSGGGASMSSMGGGYAPPPVDMARLQQLSEVMGNPYANDGQKAVAQALMQRMLPDAPDPMSDYQRQSLAMDQERLALERDKMAVGNRGTYGLNPIEGTDANGNTIYLQPGSDGSVNVMDFPDGFKPTPGFDKIDLGTEYVYRDKRTGEVLGREPKDVAGEATAKAVGGAQGDAIGTAQTNLPATEAKAAQAIGIIDSIVSDPALGDITGASFGEGFGGKLPDVMVGQKGVDLIAKVNQLKGQTFLEAFNSLKGGGAITEVEGTKAEQAIARLDRAQSRAAFEQALGELKAILSAGVERMRARAAQGGAPAAAAPVGNDADLFSKYGIAP